MLRSQNRRGLSPPHTEAVRAPFAILTSHSGNLSRNHLHPSARPGYLEFNNKPVLSNCSFCNTSINSEQRFPGAITRLGPAARCRRCHPAPHRTDAPARHTELPGSPLPGSQELTPAAPPAEAAVKTAFGPTQTRPEQPRGFSAATMAGAEPWRRIKRPEIPSDSPEQLVINNRSD